MYGLPWMASLEHSRCGWQAWSAAAVDGFPKGSPAAAAGRCAAHWARPPTRMHAAPQQPYPTPPSQKHTWLTAGRILQCSRILSSFLVLKLLVPIALHTVPLPASAGMSWLLLRTQRADASYIQLGTAGWNKQQSRLLGPHMTSPLRTNCSIAAQVTCRQQQPYNPEGTRPMSPCAQVASTCQHVMHRPPPQPAPCPWGSHRQTPAAAQGVPKPGYAPGAELCCEPWAEQQREVPSHAPPGVGPRPGPCSRYRASG